jgi:hypothetical protein
MMTLSDSLVKRRKEEQLTEALGPFNRWIAGVNLGHDPSPRECVWWWLEHDGPLDFEKRHPANDTQADAEQ